MGPVWRRFQDFLMRWHRHINIKWIIKIGEGLQISQGIVIYNILVNPPKSQLTASTKWKGWVFIWLLAFVVAALLLIFDEPIFRLSVKMEYWVHALFLWFKQIEATEKIHKLYIYTKRHTYIHMNILLYIHRGIEEEVKMISLGWGRKQRHKCVRRAIAKSS